MTMTPPLEYVYARRALLDALDALGSQRQCAVLIGSQAIYLQTAADDVPVPPMTTDADMALDATLISDEPELGSALRAAQFSCPGQPGHWVNPSGIAVDLMVAPHQSGRSKASARAARISPHTQRLARIGEGLAPALAQWSVISVGALDDEDRRAHRIKVASLGALLVAKAIKLRDRLTDQQQGQALRVVEKDALDLLRILSSTDEDAMTHALREFHPDTPAGRETQAALTFLRIEADGQGRLPQLAQTAANGDPIVGERLRLLIRELLDAYGRRQSRM